MLEVDDVTIAIVNYSCLLGAWLFWGAIGYFIATKRGIRGITGISLSILLGPIGWLIVGVFMRSRLRQCPHCAERVKEEAKVCKHCGRDLPPKLA